MELLGIDVGSSSVMVGVLRNDRIVGEAGRVRFATRHVPGRAEVAPAAILKAIRDAIALLGGRAKKVDAIALASMSPAWVAMDRRGKALTPIITHQDRRSVDVARDLESRVGKARYLRICGCRPFPGGISSTTWAWYRRHEPQRLKSADLVGHLNTFLHRQLTGARVTDPSNASFTGVYKTTTLGGWSDELCDAVGVDPRLLPEVLEGDVIAGKITASAARQFGLAEGTPMLTGIVDGSAGVLLTGANVGQLFNVIGSTDVLALCTDKPKPHERLLTRALGIGKRWLSVSTIAAAASSIYWARQEFFSEMPIELFLAALGRLSRAAAGTAGSVRFEPYLAGDRMSVEQRQGSFTGLTLAATREQLLAAIIDALATASAERLPLLDKGAVKILKTVVISGGAQDRLDKLMHRDWPKRFRFRSETEATLRGLGTLVPRNR